MESLKFIEMRIQIKESDQDRVDELAEIIKDLIMDDEDRGAIIGINDVTYEIKEKE